MTPDGSVCYFVLEAAHHPREVWRFETRTRQLARLATLNRHLDALAPPHSRLIEFRSLDGEMRQAALLLPAGYQNSERLPVVVQLYNGNFSNWVHYFGFGDFGQFNGNLFASRSIAFLRPDLPLKHGDPLKQVAGLVLPAIHRLVELGIADPERIGLAGFSYGCTLTLALLTQTSLFRAAVAIGGQVNLTSRYGALSPAGESYGMAHCESADAQGLGGSLWDRRAAYIENSSLFYLDRVRTPVLLAAGTGDPDDASQAAQAFSALRRLGCKVELRLYHGEDHSPNYWSLPNLQDWCERVVSWFETHLRPRG
jgi:dipeptidyl aminopeptidase/acylaminoacyl peptidase